MKSLLFCLFCICFVHLAEAQDFNRNQYIPTPSDYPFQQKPLEYQWPHLNYVPKYIGVIGGIQGFREFAYEAGLALNLASINEIPGAMVGGALMYKRGFRNDIETYSAEVGVYLPISFGLNFNYNTQNEYATFGVKPFIGICIYNFQFLYGFNIYSRKSLINGLRRNHFEVRYVIPIISFGKTTTEMVGTFSNYPYQENHYKMY